LHPVTPVTARPVPQADRIVHVAALLRDDSCTTYSPAQRRCGAGEGLAFKRLSEAASAAAAGDTVLLRAGTYSEQLKVATAGAPDRPITFRPYPSEIAEIAGVDAPAIFLVNAEHVVLEGLRVRQVLGWGRLENCTRITIRGNHFSDALARGTTGGLKLVRSVHNRIEGNTFVEGNDSLVVQESDSNLIVGNSFRNARHSLLSIRCGSYNIVRQQIRYRILLALALWGQGRWHEALDDLEVALDLAAPRGFVRWFVAGGPAMGAMLHTLARSDRHVDQAVRILAQIPHGLVTDSLTAREREVLQLLGQGRSNKEIARTLEISPLTARNHTANIFRKLGVADRREVESPARRP
jgi:parallel beta-helix repeat protein